MTDDGYRWDDHTTDCPTHGKECPGHFHVEIPAEGPGVAHHGDAVYMWDQAGTPAELPTGPAEAMDMTGWQEIGWVDEVHVNIRPRLEEIDRAYRDVQRTFKTASEWALTLKPVHISDEVRDLLFGKPKPLPAPKPDYMKIDLDQVKWTATPNNPKPDPFLEALGVMPWQSTMIHQWLIEGAAYQGTLNEIRALTPPDDWDDVLAEVKRLHTETPLRRGDAAYLVRERMRITGQPYSILNDTGANYAAYEMQALHAYQKGKKRGN